MTIYGYNGRPIARRTTVAAAVRPRVSYASVRDDLDTTMIQPFYLHQWNCELASLARKKSGGNFSGTPCLLETWGRR
jgi:hypothetical protein